MSGLCLLSRKGVKGDGRWVLVLSRRRGPLSVLRLLLAEVVKFDFSWMPFVRHGGWSAASGLLIVAHLLWYANLHLAMPLFFRVHWRRISAYNHFLFLRVDLLGRTATHS